MHKLAHARMTRKAATALQIAYEISGENPIYSRKTRVAVQSAYRYIEHHGYRWDSDMRAWGYSLQREKQRATLPFSVTTVPQDFDDVLYILTEALKAAHYTVMVSDNPNPNNPLVKSALLVIEP